VGIFSELLRAFTARSERYPLLRIGLFGNRAMFFAVASSLALLLLVVYVPFLQPVFNTVPLGLARRYFGTTCSWRNRLTSGVSG
jgi:Ca2+-transporting ATPase